MKAIRASRRQPAAKTWKLYKVIVPGHESAMFHAFSKEAALRQARDCEAFRWMPLARFRLLADAHRLKEYPEIDSYDYIRRHYKLDVRLLSRCIVNDPRHPDHGRSGLVLYAGPSSNHIRMALDGTDRILTFHPMDMLVGKQPVVPQAA